MTKPETKKTTHNKEDELWWSKNNGQNVRYKKRLQDEREAKEMYEDGLRELEDSPADGRKE